MIWGTERGNRDRDVAQGKARKKDGTQKEVMAQIRLKGRLENNTKHREKRSRA